MTLIYNFTDASGANTTLEIYRMNDIINQPHSYRIELTTKTGEFAQLFYYPDTNSLTTSRGVELSTPKLIKLLITELQRNFESFEHYITSNDINNHKITSPLKLQDSDLNDLQECILTTNTQDINYPPQQAASHSILSYLLQPINSTKKELPSHEVKPLGENPSNVAALGDDL